MAGLTGWLGYIHWKGQQNTNEIVEHQLDDDAHWNKRERDNLTATLADISKDVKAIRKNGYEVKP